MNGAAFGTGLSDHTLIFSHLPYLKDQSHFEQGLEGVLRDLGFGRN